MTPLAKIAIFSHPPSKFLYLPGIELVGGKTITAEDIMLNEEYAYPVDGVPSKETVEANRRLCDWKA
jgi:hypothetical protein